VALAEANLAAAEANLERAQTQDAAAGNSLTAAQISLNQAERALADAQEAYDTAWQPARDWELNDPFRGPALEAEREGTERAVQGAEEALQVARANYSLALASLNSDNAINADAALVSAQQALENARTGPRESEIAAAQLGVVQAELSLEQASFNLDQAEAALDDARLTAPWTGTVLSVDAAAGGLVSAGTPIVTLLDTEHLQFHTANLSERDLTYVAPGLPAAITLKALPDRQLDGTVAYIVPKASGSVGDAATFTVAIELDTSPGSTEALLAGMTGRVEIQRPSDF
jgi:multidrug resistance efflux pump